MATKWVTFAGLGIAIMTAADQWALAHTAVLPAGWATGIAMSATVIAAAGKALQEIFGASK